MTRTTTRLAAAAMVVALGIAGCGPASSGDAPATGAPDDAGWTAFTTRFLDGYFALDPSFAVYQGRHEYDGRLADWSDAGLTAQVEYLTRAIGDARAFDAAALSDAQRFERDYLVHVAEGQLFWLQDADAPHTNLTWYFDNGLDPNVYIARPYADAATRMRAFTAYARAIPAAAAQIKAALRLPLPLSHVDYGIAGFEGLASYYTHEARAAFEGVTDAALRAEFDRASHEAASAMQGMADWLRAERPRATQAFALGADRFARMLQATEAVDVPIDELERVGRADLARNQAALAEACAAYAPGATLQACMATMAAAKPEGGPVAEARRQLPVLRQFVADHDLVSIPGTEEAQVEEAPPYNRQNTAYIDIPGPYERGLPSVYYIAPPDPAWTAAEQAAYVPGVKDLLYTSVHEVWPGHFLNFLHANRARSMFGRVFVGYAFAEGWAHYAEEMMWDAGLDAGQPESHIGQLMNALLRDCRFLSAIGLHARGMTDAESKALFLTECYQDEGNARQQSARGTYDPAYLNYTLGKLLIRRLRDDWSATRGGRQAWKAFHDAFLSYGGPPIPLVRGAMMGSAPAAVF
ncbi:MAG: DUF885 domain-containing protein [Vicinamibacterales bacterium]